MLALKSSEPLPSSETGSKAGIGLGKVTLALASIAAMAAAWSWTHGYTLYDGDAEAHLNIARRVLDSRTPGGEQLGTGWLPLPHVVMLPFAMMDAMWKNGLAGAIPSAAAFVAAGAFLFAAARRLFSAAAALGALVLFALNPNVLYLGSAAMTEVLFAAAVLGLLWATLWFRDTGSWWAVLAAGAASNAASLTRYEGWILIPFVVLYLWISSPGKSKALVFGALASLPPLAWLAHNQFYYSDALEFYRGMWSAQAIHQRQVAHGVVYPTDHHWRLAFWYYVEAARLVAGGPVLALGILGAAVAAVQKIWWPLAFLAVCPVFYILALYSGGADLYVPTYWPMTAYNTRYALAAVLFLTFSASAALALVPARFQNAGILAMGMLVTIPRLLGGGAPSICWKEAADNSAARRAAQQGAAAFLRANYQSGSGIIFPFGTLSGVLREAGIPLREGLHEGNHPAWDASLARPELFLREYWALASAGDEVSLAVAKAKAGGRSYRLRKKVAVPGAPEIEIYHLE